jgi:hypothetical protein
MLIITAVSIMAVPSPQVPPRHRGARGPDREPKSPRPLCCAAALAQGRFVHPTSSAAPTEPPPCVPTSSRPVVPRCARPAGANQRHLAHIERRSPYPRFHLPAAASPGRSLHSPPPKAPIPARPRTTSRPHYLSLKPPSLPLQSFV